MFEPKRKHVNFQYLSPKSAPSAYYRFVRFALLIAILCNISPIYQTIAIGGSWAYLTYKLVISVLYFVAFAGMLRNKWFGCVFFCGAFALSSVLYAAETIVALINNEFSIAKLLIVMLVFEVIVFLGSCVYFRKRRLLFKPDYPMATPEELKSAAEEAKIAEAERKSRGTSPFGMAIANAASDFEKEDTSQMPKKISAPASTAERDSDAADILKEIVGNSPEE